MKSRCFSYAFALSAALLFSLVPAQSDAPSTPATDAEDAPLLRIVPGGHTSQVTSVLWTPDGKQLISTGGDKVIRIWNTESGEIVRE